MELDYEIFNKFEKVEIEGAGVCGCFKIDDAIFIIEPNYYTQLLGMKEHHADRFNEIINKMIEVVKTNKKVIFTADFEFPACHLDNFIYREITDITDPLLIFVEDKSRGSDYGD